MEYGSIWKLVLNCLYLKLFFIGGKESRTYGIDARTGTLLYECSMQGCENTAANSSEVEEVLVLKRLTHTVRAVEPRTSFERYLSFLKCFLILFGM